MKQAQSDTVSASDKKALFDYELPQWDYNPPPWDYDPPEWNFNSQITHTNDHRTETQKGQTPQKDRGQADTEYLILAD